MVRMDLTLLVVILYIAVGLVSVLRVSYRGADGVTVALTLLTCAFIGPLGWLYAYSYEGDDRRRERRARESAAREERAIWDSVYLSTKDVAKADRALLGFRTSRIAKEEARRVAEAEAAKELADARSRSKVL